MAGVKGKSGRKANERVVRHFLSEYLEELHPTEERKRIAVLCRRLVDEAEAGDMAAMKEVFDRLEGKPTAIHEHSGPEGGEIPVGLTVKWTK